MNMKRLILNYSNKCNLNCDFCYLSFNDKGVDRSIEIIERIADLGFSVITFSGGDPFCQPFFKQACAKAKEIGLFTHVDSNGLNISIEDINFITEKVDLLGLSIDGINVVHNRMRKKSFLFEKIETVLKKLQKRAYPVKINTIVTKQNYSSIIELASFLKSYSNISLWSLYQFFPLDSAKNKRDLYELDNNSFLEVIQKISHEVNNLMIENLPFTKELMDTFFLMNKEEFTPII